MRFIFLAGAIFIVLLRSAAAADPAHDVVVYGGTSAAVTAAIQVRRMDHSVIIVSPDQHLGGLTSGGLGQTDSGRKQVVGGLSREFYQRIYDHYQQPAAWKQQTRNSFGKLADGFSTSPGDRKSMWVFEPHVAEEVYDNWIAEYQIPVVRNGRLDRGPGGVTIRDGRIESFRTLDRQTYAGKMFIDATYEGDLMAVAGVSNTTGREASSQYDETFNGNQIGILHHSHYFQKPIDPYQIKGDPSSGLLPRIDDSEPGVRGAADGRIQAYCFRMCLTNDPDNRIKFAKPAGYDKAQYELLERVFESGWDVVLGKFDPIPNRKTDTNNHGPFSTDNIGMNYDYPSGSYETRQRIIDEHETYQRGLMYFMANDSEFKKVRDIMSSWGLCKDEFVDNGGWPHQLYIREARRMVGQYVMTENDVLDKVETPDSVGMGSYTMDSHNVRRYVTDDGYVQNEGDIGVGVPAPYEIAYGSLLPKKGECENLLVPVCVSSSHIAFGSIRMEPVFMVLGQSAATAAAIAIDNGIAVQEVPYETLRARLLSDGQVLETDEFPPLQTIQLEGGTILDDTQSIRTGDWTESRSTAPFYGTGYAVTDDVSATATYHADLEPGRYEVRVTYSAHPNRSTAVTYQLSSADFDLSTIGGLDQTVALDIESPTRLLATIQISGEVQLEVLAGQGGYTVIDAVQFLKIAELPTE